MSKLGWMGLVAAIALASACSGRNGGAEREQIGTAQARIDVVPPSVGCIRIVAAGVVTVSRDFPATPGQGTILALTQLPTGNVTFSGSAFNATCAPSLDPSTASWITDPVTTTVTPGTAGNVALTFRMNGNETITGNFDDGSDGGTRQIIPTTWDPTWSVGGVTYSNGNLSISGNSAGNKNVRTIDGKSSGKWYWEITATGGSATSNGGGLGILESIMPSSATYIGSVPSGLSFGYGSAAYYYLNWSGASTSGQPPASSAVSAGIVYMFALDMDSGRFWAGQNGAWYNSGNPGSALNPAAAGITGTVYPGVTLYASSIDSFTANFGASTFAYPVPAGFNPGVYNVPTTWDPAWSVAGATYGNGNHTVSGNSVGTKNVRTLVGRKAGKYYWEITATGGSAAINSGGLGVLESAMPSSASYIGSVPSGLSFGYGSGTYYATWAGVTLSTAPAPAYAAVNAGTVYMFALDMNSGRFWAGQNGTWYNAGDPASAASPAATGIAGTVYPGVTLYSGSNDSFAANFGSSAFAYAVPSGFGAGFY